MSRDILTATITCPSGHSVSVTDLKSYVKLDVEEPDDAVIFDCPGGKRGHQFTLRKAVASGMFNTEEAARIRRSGIKHREDSKNESD